VRKLFLAHLSIPTPLRKYTNGQRVVTVNSATLSDLFDALDRAYPGLKFRVINEQGQVREHIKLFVNQRSAPNLDAPIQAEDEIRIILAISGGNKTPGDLKDP
jgi:sulfur-carrier protein